MSAHTPTPWRWGKDWVPESFGDDHNSEYSGVKYADLQLYGAGRDAVVLPLRIDHYSVEVDCIKCMEGIIRTADREFILRAVNCHDDLLEACRAALALTLEHARPTTHEGYVASNAVTALCRAAILKATGEEVA